MGVMAQGAQQAGSITALRGTHVPEQGQAAVRVGQVGVRNSQSLVLSGPLSPACAQVPRSFLSSGDLSSSAWALIRSCPQERRAAEQKQSFCPRVHFCSAGWAEQFRTALWFLRTQRPSWLPSSSCPSTLL